MSRAWIFFLFMLSFAMNLGLLSTMRVIPPVVSAVLFVAVIGGMIAWDARGR